MGRGLSSRQTQHVVKDTEIRKPSNSNEVQKLQMALHAKDGGRSVREPDAENPHVRFDERGVVTERTAEPLRHRQTKGAGTDMLSLTSPRHISTLPIRDVAQKSQMRK